MDLWDKNTKSILKMSTQQNEADKVITKEDHEEFVSELLGAHYFGKLVTHFVDGKIVRLNKDQTFMKKDIDDLKRN